MFVRRNNFFITIKRSPINWPNKWSTDKLQNIETHTVDQINSGDQKSYYNGQAIEKKEV